MNLADVTVAKLSLEAMPGHLPRLLAIYKETGVVYLPGLLVADAGFQCYVRDLTWLTDQLAHAAGLTFEVNLRLEERLSLLAKSHRRSVGTIYDIGTRPAKLLSATKVKYHAGFLHFVEGYFGPAGVPATPTLSDTLHVFPPGEENYKYNLPIHQDFPYLIQSPEQITLWISLSAFAAGAGGITVWPGSHSLGVAKHRKNRHGHYEAEISDEELTRFSSLTLEAGFGDVLIVDSLCLHRSEPNRTSDKTRIATLSLLESRAFADAVRHR
ncbi:MAG: phytanoyl-CoA dioxygenase family protein [Planctomycetota bacterium]